MSGPGLWMLGLSLPFQWAAAYFAFALARRAGVFRAWGLVTLGVTLLALRKTYTFYLGLATGGGFMDDVAESVALLVSASLGLGMWELYRVLGRRLG